MKTAKLKVKGNAAATVPTLFNSVHSLQYGFVKMSFKKTLFHLSLVLYKTILWASVGCSASLFRHSLVTSYKINIKRIFNGIVICDLCCRETVLI